MAKNIGARKCGKQTVVCSSPSMEKTPMGNSTPPIPYPVKEDLSSSKGVSGNVRLNSDEAFTMASDSSKVTGDKAGTAKGTGSGTTGAKAEPIKHSKSVRINKQWAVRCGDKFHMNDKNTKGSLTCSSYSVERIKDNGEVEGYCTPGDSFEDYISSLTPVDKPLREKFMDAFNHPVTGYKKNAQSLYGEGIASWTTDGFADAVNGINQSIDDFAGGNIGAGATAIAGAVARATPYGKVYSKIEDKVDTASAVASGEVPSGKDKKKKNNSKDTKGSDGEHVKGKKCKNANKNKGDCAERKLEETYKEGCDSLNAGGLMNGSGHGFDHAFKCKDGLVFAETKGTVNGGNHIPLSKGQTVGGKEYVRRRLLAMQEGVSGKGGKWKAFEDDDIFEGKLDDMEKEMKKAGDNIQYKKCRVWVEDDKTGCYGKGGKGKCKKKKGKKPNPKCEDWVAK